MKVKCIDADFGLKQNEIYEVVTFTKDRSGSYFTVQSQSGKIHDGIFKSRFEIVKEPEAEGVRKYRAWMDNSKDTINRDLCSEKIETVGEWATNIVNEMNTTFTENNTAENLHKKHHNKASIMFGNKELHGK